MKWWREMLCKVFGCDLEFVPLSDAECDRRYEADCEQFGFTKEVIAEYRRAGRRVRLPPMDLGDWRCKRRCSKPEHPGVPAPLSHPRYHETIPDPPEHVRPRRVSADEAYCAVTACRFWPGHIGPHSWESEP